MIVDLLAHTQIVGAVAEEMGYRWPSGQIATDLDVLHEVADRERCQKWAIETNSRYMASLVGSGRFSALEHASITVSIREVSRSLAYELERYNLSCSILDQRYVDETDGGFTIPSDLDQLGAEATIILSDAHQAALDTYGYLVNLLTEQGMPRKLARLAAGTMLPGGHHTRLVCTGSIRAWRELVARHAAFKPSGEPYDDLEIFNFSRRVLVVLRDVAPNSVEDLWRTLYLEWEKTDYAVAQAERERA